MKNYMVVAFLSFITILFLFAPHTMALDQAQEAEYLKARLLLNEEKVEDAKSILLKLSVEASSDFKVRLGLLDVTIEEARILKSKEIKDWEYKIYAAYGGLKSIFYMNIASPEIYLSFAKCYWVNDSDRKALKSIEKALYYKPDYPEAFILKGDIYFEKSKEFRVDPFDDGKARKERMKTKGIAESSYKKALSSRNIDSFTQAFANYKLGHYYSYYHYKDKSMKYWQNAVNVSPNTYWGKKSQERLNEF